MSMNSRTVPMPSIITPYRPSRIRTPKPRAARYESRGRAWRAHLDPVRCAEQADGGGADPDGAGHQRRHGHPEPRPAERRLAAGALRGPPEPTEISSRNQTTGTKIGGEKSPGAGGIAAGSERWAHLRIGIARS
jgi:hypothetical protein